MVKVTKFTPPVPPRGPGRDLPKESNANFAAGKGEEIKLRPPSKVAPEARARYPYNKVTKHLDGSMLEFNTTPGTEYINLQTGDLKARITLFRNGGIEIVQQGPIFLHEIKNTVPSRPDTFGDKIVPIHETNVYDGVIQTSSKYREHIIGSAYKLKTDMAFYEARTIIDLKARNIILKGEVTIEGNLTVNGNVNIIGDLFINGVNITTLFAESGHDHE